VFRQHADQVAAFAEPPATNDSEEASFGEVVDLRLANGVPRQGHARTGRTRKIKTTLAYTHILPGCRNRASSAVERAIFGSS
jgi:hypothetical protein